MKKMFLFWLSLLMLFTAPALACGSLMAGQRATPTPTKTPRLVRLTPQLLESTPTAPLLPTYTPAPQIPPTDTPAPVPPTDTPAPPTDMPPPPTDTPVPPPPPTHTPAPPPPPTNTPAPPPPTQPPAPQGPQVTIEFPNGTKFSPGDKVKIIFIVRDPNGVSKFKWGIFMQNQSPLIGGDKECGGATECREEMESPAPVLGTYIVGADAVNVKGIQSRGVGEIYVR